MIAEQGAELIELVRRYLVQPILGSGEWGDRIGARSGSEPPAGAHPRLKLTPSPQQTLLLAPPSGFGEGRYTRSCLNVKRVGER